MRTIPTFLALLLSLTLFAQPDFTLEEVKSYPFPTGLTSAKTGSRIAWAFNEQGLRNIYVAEGPSYEPKRLTSYTEDDGQALSSIAISADGQWLVYIRGGDFGSNWNDAGVVNPSFDPNPPKVQIWSIRFDGGDPIALGEGENPRISPSSNQVAFTKSNQIWVVPIDGSKKAESPFNARGSNGSSQWSPDGSKIAFQSNRDGRSFIGVYTDATTPIFWIDPAFNRDSSPRWSPDGKSIAFLRRPGSGGAPENILEDRHYPWEIRTANIGKSGSSQIWKAPETVRGNMPTTHGRANLNWANGRIVYLSYQDGWPHLYSIPEAGGDPLLLTPGNYMAEYISMSPDGKWLAFAGNAGPDTLDIDRRHIIRVPVDKAAPEVLTKGSGIEWTPVFTGDGQNLVFLGATAQQTPLPVVYDLANHQAKMLAIDFIPKTFPLKHLVTPTQVVFKAPDGTNIHATMFNKEDGNKKKPAIIYVHGGPPRQMLLGWHYSSYYSNAYAVNQYLANLGFVVLSVNYRLGIGYGYEFHRPVDGGTRGASEYQDVKAAGEWLANQPSIDASKIGIYGGSYGGYLTALALGKNSDLFATGVDIHGVHDRTVNRAYRYTNPNQYEKAPDGSKALEVAWQSSPVAYVDSWKSPVLIIHADDDRNVDFKQSTDLVQRLIKNGVELETLVILDDTHHFMMHSNQMKVNNAAAEYLNRKIGPGLNVKLKSKK